MFWADSDRLVPSKDDRTIWRHIKHAVTKATG
jgi:hypothetical protein